MENVCVSSWTTNQLMSTAGTHEGVISIFRVNSCFSACSDQKVFFVVSNNIFARWEADHIHCMNQP